MVWIRSVKNMYGDYYNWLVDLIEAGPGTAHEDYTSFIHELYLLKYRWQFELDENRAIAGLALRDRYAYEAGVDRAEMSDGPCSVLEMMIALSFRIEEEIMINSKYGNRTGQWFWNMIVNLGLGKMDDNNFNEQYVYNVIQDFLHHRYSRDGHGSLIVIPNSRDDLRKVEIWTAFMRYLNIMGE